MSQFPSNQAITIEKQDLVASVNLFTHAKSNLTKIAAWINDCNIPFLVSSISMIVMLLWAGAYKMTAPGAEGIIPLVFQQSADQLALQIIWSLYRLRPHRNH